MMRLIYDGRLPGANEFNNAQRRNRYVGARLKRDTQNEIEWILKPQIRQRYQGKVRIRISFYEKTMRRDPDNVISGGCKVILDALQELGVIKRDSPKYIHLVPEVWYDKEHPRIEMEINPA